MSSPTVAQLKALADLFEEALNYCHPESVALLGIAGGNGLDRINLRVTRRIVGVDIHPTYLETVRRRYPQLPLRLHCIDLEHETIDEEAVALVYAALIFEHAGTGQCLKNAASFVAPCGHLAVVLQLPSPAQADVSPTQFHTMQSLGEHFRLVDQAKMLEALESISACDIRLAASFLPERPFGSVSLGGLWGANALVETVLLTKRQLKDRRRSGNYQVWARSVQTTCLNRP